MLATQHDVPRIMQRLAWILKNGSSPYLRGADLVSAECGVRDYIHRGQAVIIDGFFIMVDISKEWFSDKLYLFEKIVIRLEPGSDAQRIPLILEQLARINGCEAVVAGDALAGKMTPFYERAGWEHLGTTFTKETN